jgi:hypothetical protein
MDYLSDFQTLRNLSMLPVMISEKYSGFKSIVTDAIYMQSQGFNVF